MDDDTRRVRAGRRIDELRNSYPSELRRCIESATAFMISFERELGLDKAQGLKLGAAVEDALIEQALRLLP